MPKKTDNPKRKRTTQQHMLMCCEAMSACRSQLSGLLFDSHHPYVAAEVWEEVALIRGVDGVPNPLSESGQSRWVAKVQASSDPAHLFPKGYLSGVTRHLLLTNAVALRGNVRHLATKQARQTTLARMALGMVGVDVVEWIKSIENIPERMNAIELENYITELRMGARYSLRQFRRLGVKRSKKVYYQHEIKEILDAILAA